MIHPFRQKIKDHFFEFTLFTLLLIFSSFLFWQTFRINTDGNMQVASKLWSDFGATIPLIRSFSMGSNFPPQYPIFAGPPIRYHFVFYAIVGFLEKSGIRLDWALNSLSIICFFLLLIFIYYFGKFIFKSKAVGVMSIILFLFNGSFGFLEFFKNHPLSIQTASDIIKNTSFSSFGPYDKNIVSAFWNLNIYTNQRHLALAYAFSLLLFLIIFRYAKDPKKLSLNKSIILGLSLGIFPFIHLSAFIMSGISLLIFLFVYPKLRSQIFLIGVIALILAIPQYLYMGKPEVITKFLRPGYLVDNLTTYNFIKYWLFNLGLTALLAPIGFLIAQKDQRKLLIPFLGFFILGNLFQFTPDIAQNHKFFNLFVIGLNFFTSYLIFWLYKKSIYLLPIIIILVIFLTFSGIVDLFPIINDYKITIVDVQNNNAASFIKTNTPKNALFLNSSFLYHPASLAGRKIFVGWPYFAWSAGYDTEKRGKIIRDIFESTEKEETCTLLQKNRIDYFTTQDTSGDSDFPLINLEYFSTKFINDYSDPNISIYNVSRNCIN